MNLSSFLEKFLSICTKDNITFALAAFGSIGTAISCGYRLITNRKNLDFNIIGQRSDSESILLYMAFVNKSRLPISITSISVNINGVFHSCQEIPITTFEETTRCKGEIISHHVYKSIPLPFTIPGLGSTSGYVYAEFPEVKPQPDATHLTFQVSTNRGKVIEKTLSLGHHLD